MGLVGLMGNIGLLSVPTGCRAVRLLVLGK